MNVEGSFKITASRRAVWNALQDPQVLAKCLPGCEELTPSGTDAYVARLRVGIAAVKGNYQGTVAIHDKVPPERFRMTVEGKGNPGFLKGEGTIELSEQAGETTIAYRGTIQVGGLIAGVGQRLVHGAARMVLNNFFKTLAEQFD